MNPSRAPSMTPGSHTRVHPSGLTGTASTSAALPRVKLGNRLPSSRSVIQRSLNSFSLPAKAAP